MTHPIIPNEMTTLNAALAHVQAGFKVFPAHAIRDGVCTCGGAKNCSPGKHPIGSLVPRGVLDATGDPDVVNHWWDPMPDANIGVATGKNSDLVVLDVDGLIGEETLADIERKYGSLPPTWQVKTGKGRHLYFRYPTNVTKVKSVARKKLGLDVRADGGYVIAPPSLHESGHRYIFDADSTDELADCPAWVVAYADGELKIDGPAIGTAGQRTKAETAPTPYSQEEEARLRSALAFIPADERDTWRDMGAALHSLGWGEKGLAIWTDWSRTCAEKYDEADQQKTWESFDRPYAGARITPATIFYKACQHGWIDETRQHDFHTDLGNARRFVRRHGKNIRFIPEWRKWIVWNGSHWDIDKDGAITRLAKDTVEAMYPEALGLANEEDRTKLLKHAIRSQAEARLDAMVSLAESEGFVVLAAHKLDADPWLLGVQNGVIDLKTGQFRPARQEDLITKHANVVFDPEAKCPEWLKFLGTVTGGDADLQSYIQRAVGYTLTGSVREEVLFVLHGTGSNGKSTFRETLHALFGDYALAADASLLTERKKAGGATEEIARLKGRRFVAVNETAENDQLNEARVKFITSQDMISARNLYGHLFDFYPSHKSFLTTNHKPIVRGTDEGIWRRIHLLPFTVAIPAEKVEKDFRERRLMPELPGILNWALEGLAAYRKQGLKPPVTVLASTQEYREDMDVVGQWIAERCELNPKATVPTSDAHNDYSYWASQEVGWVLTKPRFRRQLSDRGFAAVKGAHGQRMIKGLRLKSTVAAKQTAADVREPPEADAAISPWTQSVADVGEQTETDAAFEERIKKLLAKPPQSGDVLDGDTARL
jgi:putative DNA primase/helicase